MMEEDIFKESRKKKSPGAIALGIIGISLGAASVAISIVALALAASKR